MDFQAGAKIAAALRVAVKQELGYTCSAGIAHNKLLAKIGSGRNKPGMRAQREISLAPWRMYLIAYCRSLISLPPS